ncbi:4-hydroxythreonine-4-phosphate dehydrogenase [Magnetococcus marinus MC-1]|uniref:4-hydroxythreonine-4-phosphate dehydrogenase n=2 Tax=Magnetococcus TaxID=162171 RepID=A0LA33_MAGMM|nr:4-hydroxythreonine-4-phosphate dehydrogenase [Magnetococcus marinus MC-1]
MDALPIALTMGDPAGIGPEIVLKAFAQQQRERQKRLAGAKWLWVGDPEVLLWTAQQMGLVPPKLQRVRQAAEVAQVADEVLAVLPLEACIDRHKLAFGVADGAHAKAVVESIETATALAMSGQVGGVVTPPIHKGVLHAGGYRWPGHTELLGHCTGVTTPVMMLAGRGLRVVPATIHQSIRSVPDSLSVAKLTQIFSVVGHSLQQDFGLREPRIAICALNPHAGEGGAFGDEERRIIQPAMAALMGEVRLEGPFPADALFSEAARAPYGAIICMYHDQALIPIKMHCFGEATNITLGLPIIRTSVDHGTAYDIAGSGRAKHGALLIAVEQAARMAANRRTWQQEHP